ncbi:MAG: alanine racemase [Deltaproteobacteria bacterium]|nr:alanine racemase [Deltaproteobacteria bacterium]
MHVQREHQWVEVDLDAIRKNVAAFRASTGRKILAVVKANGYGHGAANVAKAVFAAGGEYVGVTSLGEAAALRSSGVNGKILVMGPQFPHEYARVPELDVECVVWTKEQALALNSIGMTAGVPSKAHVKVDIGMSRFGLLPAEAPEFLRTLSELPGLQVVGLASHLSASDEDASITSSQLKRFRALVEILEAERLRPPLVHVSNSGASSSYPELWFDMVRLGIVLYGYPALPDAEVNDALTPALSWKARIVSLREIPAETTVSYGGEYKTKHAERIGVIAAGYTDGFRRTPKNCNEVLVRGHRLKTLGRICQQFCMVNLDDVPEVRVGDEVTLLGSERGERISAVDIARRWGTNEWDVLCGIAGTIERRYLHSADS